MTEVTRRLGRSRHVVAAVLLLALALVAGTLFAACGGDDDDTPDGTGGDSGEAGTNGNGSNPDPEQAETDDDDDGPATDVPAGAPDPEDPDFPDVYGKLEPGGVAEADTGDDLTGVRGTIRVTIKEIVDGATENSIAYELPAGMKLWAVTIVVESVGDGTIPVAEFSLRASDGRDYVQVYGTGVGDGDTFFGELAKGESNEGHVVFEIPEDATVQFFYIDPSIYVGRNIVFLP